MDIAFLDVSVAFPSPSGEVFALRHIDLTLKTGEITALVGESGSGKSLLGAAVVGLLEKGARVDGAIFYGEKDLLSLPIAELTKLRGRRIGWIAQDPVHALDPMQRVGPQITEAVRWDTGRGEKTERGAAVTQLQKFGFHDAAILYGTYPLTLSGGMAQRVLTAMMALPRPEWLVADEPTKGLDAFARRQVAHSFRTLQAEGTSILLITHDLFLAERLSDRTVILYAGEIMEDGRTEAVFSHPRHPYTQGLLAARPGGEMVPIPGVAPDPANLPPGCLFSPRCDRYQAGSCDETPLLPREVCGEEPCGGEQSAHRVRCCRWGE